ncbi:hypothetical protein N431DRAFT_333931 [Stipitochalara longipes BDJ]|nr:hypothetical protein N431DRAFT_333931 [Stipitochalara longipes BDJ]
MASFVTASSPATANVSADPPAKEYRCTWGNCTKSFSRAEHLHRHALNHDETKGNFTCQRCQAVFRRRDLLDRHMARHKEKDEEAGGEGLGRLQTRKRLWRDSTGAVVTKRRPEHEKRSLSSTPASKRLKVRDDSFESTGFSNRKDTPISPPPSTGEHISHRPNAARLLELAGEAPRTDDLWPAFSEDAILPEDDGTAVESLEFLCNASWGSQSQESTSSDILYHDFFAPDTASSFNNPFTTLSYYNWLFEKETWPTLGFDSSHPPGNSSMSSLDNFPHFSPQQYGNKQRQVELLHPSVTSNHPFKQSSNGFQIPRLSPDVSRRSFSQESMSPETSAANQILALSQMAGTSMAASLGYLGAGSSSPIPTQFHRNGQDYLPTPIALGSSYEMDSNLDKTKQVRKLPVIDEAAWQSVLSLIDRGRPKVPDGLEITRDHPLLSLPVLQDYCDLYFTRFNTSYPLLHQATFDPGRVDSLLLTSVLLLGATYSDRESHLFAICVHDIMRVQILGSPDFTTRPPLWILQTILLVECFGKSRAGQLQHDMSHLFHGLLINLIRRSDCQSARCQDLENNEKDIDHKWRAQVDAEQRRRLALLCFMWDTQHAVLFSQSLCMNAAELKLTLPWNECLWEAETAEKWHRLHLQENTQPLYLSVLKSYFNNGTGSRSWNLNALSRVLVLHGLMSVAWDLNRRDQTSLGLAVASQDESWQARIGRSYDTWKEDFDSYSREKLLALDDNDRSKEDFQKFCTAILAIYHAAHIILNAEINDMQINAGANHIIGRLVTKVDRERSQIRVECWAKSSSPAATKAASHAAHILRDSIRRLKNWDAGDFFHYPWLLYLATLTCWTFQICTKNNEAGDEAPVSAGDDEDSDWDSRAEMNALVSAMARSSLEELGKVASKYRTGDLPRVIAKHLSSIRWAVVQEGMIVLKGLTGKINGR